jgi:hypothetical protein
MIILILWIFYAFYFYSLYSGDLEKAKPDLHILLSIPFGIMVIAGIFWGYTTKPYGDYFSIKGNWFWSRPDMELIFIFPICITLVLSYLVVYRLGKISGVNLMKNTEIFRENIDKS